MSLDSNQPVAWLTGASSGIGRALAFQLFALGYSLILSARKQQALESLADEIVQKQPEAQSNFVAVLPFDVSRDDSVSRAQRALKNISSRLDLVIANAGACEYLDFENLDWTMMQRIIQVNYVGTVNTIHTAYPLLIHTAQQGQRPHVVGIASQAILMPFPRAQAYGSSKAAVHYFLQSLRMDFAAKGIDVTSVLPGFVETPMTAQNNFSMPFIIDPESAAKRIVTGIQKRPAVFAFPKRLYYLLRFFSFFSGLWFKKMSPPAKEKSH